jgi:hypothetical protein
MPESLWPDDIGESSLVTPVSILKEQAADLGEKTKQLVVAEVVSSSQADRFAHRFLITAPALGNYKFELFQVTHGISFYPMQGVWRGAFHALSSEQQFLDFLRMVFRDQTTKNVIQSIIAQVKT